ncbi:hypothetical protein KIW84_022619 [Lathyrus oleraceus]|uniref:Uncharacterized protein n=1 Tax=Pisum sativum TaxID=3888 RepID=A0A9D4YDJ6_PEA|nr:hypothetical protein KIW84_022619 [Pisum sativum]
MQESHSQVIKAICGALLAWQLRDSSELEEFDETLVHFIYSASIGLNHEEKRGGNSSHQDDDKKQKKHSCNTSSSQQSSILLLLQNLLTMALFSYKVTLNSKFPKWSPISREIYLDRLAIRYDCDGEPSQLALIDVFVSTENPLKKPPLTTANTVLSILSVDYPVDKVPAMYRMMVQLC